MPTWSGIAIVLAALLTGMLISIMNLDMGVPYLACFVVAGLAVALFTELRGLFLTVAMLPISFAAVTILTSFIITRMMAADGTPMFNKTTIVTAVYPLAQYFLVLAAVTAGAIIIAVLRLKSHQRNSTKRAEEHTAQRRQEAEADRRNRETVTRARAVTGTPPDKTARAQDRAQFRRPVQERDPDRRRTHERPSRAQRPPMDDDLYANE